MSKPSNHKGAIYVVALLILSLFTQVLPRPVTVVAAKDVKTEIPATTIETTKEGLPVPQPAPTVVPNNPAAATITATLTDNITQATKVAPGGTVNYTAVITNTAAVGNDATNVTFNAPLDANETLVAGSVHASPIAFNDTYNWVGNTQLDSAARSLPKITANDVAVNPPAGTDTFNLVTQTNAATSLSGTVTVNADGSFVYTPPVGRPNIADGASVNDTFTYTITNSADPTLTATGTATITLTGRVWYLQAGAAGTGLSNSPSSGPSAMSTAADKSTDIFYVFSNAGSLNGLFTVDAGQQLLGQGVNLVINIPVLGSTTLFSSAAPTPTTTNTAGNCVTLGGAPGNNTLSGFNIGNCTGGTAIVGVNVGTLTVSTMSINTNGGGLDLTGSGNPVVSVVLSSLTSSGGTNNIKLATLGGSLTLGTGNLTGASGNSFDVSGGTESVTYSGAITQASNAAMVSVSGGHATGTITFQTGALSATNGTGLQFNNADGIYNFNASTDLIGGDAGIDITNGSGGTFSFGSAVNIQNPSGIGYNEDTSTATVTDNGPITKNNNANNAVNINAKTGGTTTFNGGIVASTTTAGAIDLTNTGGTVNFTGGLNLTTSSGIGFNATGAGATVSATQNNTSIVNTINSSSGSALNVVNTTIGASGLTFRSISSGAGTNNGITLSSTGATGGLTVTGDGANISVGGNSTGGTISGKSGADLSFATEGCGIYLNNTSNVVLRRMTINGTNQNYGIRGTAVAGFTLEYSTVNGTNGTNFNTAPYNSGEGSIYFGDTATNGVTGSATFTSNNISGGAWNNLSITNIANGVANITTVTIKGNTFGLNGALPNGNHSFAVDNRGTATLNVVLGGTVAGEPNTFTGSPGDMLNLVGQTGSTMDVVMRNNTLTNNHAGNIIGGGGVTLATQGVMNFHVTGNSMRDANGSAVTIQKASASTVMNGFFDSNTIGASGVLDSGSKTGNGLFSYAGAGTASMTITSNTIRRIHGNGHIYADNTGGSYGANFDIRGNTFDQPGAGEAFAIGMTNGSPGSADTTNVCAIIGGSVAADKNTVGGFVGASIVLGSSGVNNSGTHIFNLPGLGASTEAAVEAFVTGNNTMGGSTVDAYVDAPATFAAFKGNPGCGTPTSRPELGYNNDRRERYGSTNATALAKGELAKPRVAAIPITEGSSIGESFSADVPVVTTPVKQSSSKIGDASVLAKATTPKATAAEVARIYRSEAPLSNHAVRSNFKAASQDQNAPTSGETITINTVATLPGTKAITIKYSATVNTPPLARSVQTQGTVTFTGGAGSPLLTTDPETGTAVPTKTNIDTTVTWTGASTGDWNTVSNWTVPGPGPAYVPGVSNSGVSDVIIQCCNTPMITANDVDIFSLDLSSVVILSPGRILQLSGGAGSNINVTVDGGAIIGGTLRFSGAGPHNVGGLFNSQGISSATVLLSPTVVNLTSPLQMGALTVNSTATMNITGQTLSLKGDLSVPGGATFTTTGSTVVYNGSTAQQAAGIAYNNLTINNTIGAHVTAVTLTGNATVNTLLTLTSSDLDTGAFTLTMPVAASSGPATNATDVVGNVKRTGFVSGGAALSFGNPFNTIKINSGAAPADITVNLVKSSPVGFSQSVQRTYTITPNGVNGPATLRLHYLDSELNGNIPESSLNLRRFNGTVWKPVVATASNTADATNNWLENNAVATFSPWTFSTFTPTASNSLISGRITDNDGNPLGGVVVGLSNGRRTITRADGNYLFESVPTGEFYTLTPMLANHSFTPHTRSFSLVGNMTDAAFSAQTDATQTANPLDTDMYFVRQQYLDFLGREPDEGGLQFWTNQISTCLDDQVCIHNRRIDVSAAFFITQEFQQSGSYIYDLYQGTLNRRPAFTEYSTDRPQVIGGADLDTQKDAFARSFVQRPEFVAKYQSNTSAETFVDALIQSVQLSGVDLSAERDGLIAAYNSGIDQTTSRALVVRAIADDTTFRQSQYNKAFVLMEYFDYLQRDIDQGGYNFWLDVLNTGKANNYRGMVCSFLTATEYQHRFATVVTHNNGECGGQ